MTKRLVLVRMVLVANLSLGQIAAFQCLRCVGKALNDYEKYSPQ